MLSKHCDQYAGRVHWPEEILNISGIILNIGSCFNCADQSWVKREYHNSVVSLWLDVMKLYFLLLVVINGGWKRRDRLEALCLLSILKSGIDKEDLPDSHCLLGFPIALLGRVLIFGKVDLKDMEQRNSFTALYGPWILWSKAQGFRDTFPFIWPMLGQQEWLA